MLNNNIKTEFSIKDLENITGIKAHTIRIWEKRYALLSPQRTSGNARYYDINSLQKLMNVVLLNNNGLKISKIACLADNDIIVRAREIAMHGIPNDAAINSLKVAMFQFDVRLFNLTYNELLIRKSFREIFKEVFLPFLNHIGLLWQTNTLTPAHEHFISNLIAQKLHLNTEKLLLNAPIKTDEVYVMFLPLNEIHELGLMFINYELALRGYKTIYLGQSVPVENLNNLISLFDKICFVTSCIVYPTKDKMEKYLQTIEKLLEKDKHKLRVIARDGIQPDRKEFKVDIQFFNSTVSFVNSL